MRPAVSILAKASVLTQRALGPKGAFGLASRIGDETPDRG